MSKQKAVKAKRKVSKTNLIESQSNIKQHPVVKDQVYKLIRLEIISFGFKPGERISEAQLAERFGVGIASIRAVLPRLVQEGFVINQRRLGHMVTPVTVQDILDVYQLRSILEPKAAEMAIDKIDVETLEKLDAKSKTKIPENDRIAEVTSLIANQEFHVAIAVASGNERLSAWISQLHDFSIRFQYLIRRSKAHSDEWTHSHEPLIQAFKDNDAQAAGEYMREHIENGKNIVLGAIIQLPEIQDLNIGSLSLEAGNTD